MQMSSENHSAYTSSAAGNNNASGEGNQSMAWGRPFNDVTEAGPSIVGRSFTISSGHHSASSSFNRNCNAPADRMERRRNSSNEVRHPNRNIWRSINNRGPLNEMSPSYRPSNIMAPHMESPQPNLQAYGTVPPPILPVQFIGNPEPSTCSSFQGLNVFPDASNCSYYYPTHPYAGCFVPLQDIYTSQQSYLLKWLDDVRNRLQKQIEYYFSSENLETDFYLKSKMDPNGWVPITLIGGFKRAEALIMEAQFIYNYSTDQITIMTSIEQFISDSLISSDNVEVQGDKIRKRHKWQKWVSPQNTTQSGAKYGGHPQKTPK